MWRADAKLEVGGQGAEGSQLIVTHLRVRLRSRHAPGPWPAAAAQERTTDAQYAADRSNSASCCILSDHLSRVWCGSRCLETGLDARVAKQEKPATTAAQASERSPRTMAEARGPYSAL
jgi:hypothetical protein